MILYNSVYYTMYLVKFKEKLPYNKWKFLATNRQIYRDACYPLVCWALINYHCVVSVTMVGSECSNDGQDIDILQKNNLAAKVALTHHLQRRTAWKI